MKRTAIMTALFVLVTGAALAGDLPTNDEIATDKGPLKIVPIEHATFVMEWNGVTIAVDPVGGAEAFVDHSRADLVLITDIHGDHLSVETVESVTQPKTTIVAPSAVAEQFPEGDRAGIKVIANGESIEWEGVGVAAVPMYNLDPEKQRFHPEGRGNGYVVDFGDKKIYIAGDTEDIPEMRALKDIDAAFVCMNLPYTMTVDAAADAVLEFKPKIVYPYHYRGKGGISDLDRFTALVAADPDIEVRRLKWY